MRRLFNIVLCACALALASCVSDGKVKDAASNTPSEEKGALTINIGTRTEGGAERDYILSIFKNESGKSTLVRKYDSSKEDMQKPEFIWLLAGNYTAKVECGTAVAATFNEAEQYLYGDKDFDITAGETKTVDLVAVMQNIPVEVVFDQTITDGFHDGYNVEVKADDNVKLTYTESKKGYFIMPEGVTTLSWQFVGTFEYEDGEQVNVNKSGTIENVELKKGYKLSFTFTKDASGVLDNIIVDIDESIEERDDHFAFNPDPELKGDGFDLNAVCNYSGGDRRYVATSPAEFCAVSIVAGGKEFNPVAEAVAGVTYSGLNTTKLYVTLSDDFFNALSGGSQIIELCVTDTSGGEVRKELPYNLQGVNGVNSANVDLWLGTASISATVFGSPASVEIICREGEGEWQHFAAASSGTNTYTAQAQGFGAGRSYEYNLIIDGKTVGTSQIFTTAQGVQIPNGDMETWSSEKDPFADASSKYWDSGNEGSSMAGAVLTTRNEDVRPGSKGKYSAYLNSEVAKVLSVEKFAAGNIFIGHFGSTIINLSNPGATVYFGQPFSYNAKPKGVKMWIKYNCGSINKVGSDKLGVSSGSPDLTKIFCCMCQWSGAWCVDSTNAESTTFSPSMENIKNCSDNRYNGVLYTAYFESTTSNHEWHELYIPFEKIEGADESNGANYLVFTATCSGYGDFFTGSSDSWMYIDDIELVY